MAGRNGFIPIVNNNNNNEEKVIPPIPPIHKLSDEQLKLVISKMTLLETRFKFASTCHRFRKLCTEERMSVQYMEILLFPGNSVISAKLPMVVHVDIPLRIHDDIVSGEAARVKMGVVEWWQMAAFEDIKFKPLARNVNWRVFLPMIRRFFQMVIFEELDIRTHEDVNLTDQLEFHTVDDTEERPKSEEGKKPQINFPEEKDIRKSFRIKCFTQGRCNVKDLFYWLNALEEGYIKRIKLFADENPDYPIEGVLRIPKVVKCPSWQISLHLRAETLADVVRVWIKDAPVVNSSFLVEVMRSGAFKIVRKTFPKRIVYDSENGKEIRIRTQNPSKHLLLGIGFDHTEAFQRYNLFDEEHNKNLECIQLIRLMVICSKTDEKKHDKDEKWMSLLDPQYLYPGCEGVLDSDSDSYDSDGPLMDRLREDAHYEYDSDPDLDPEAPRIFSNPEARRRAAPRPADAAADLVD